MKHSKDYIHTKLALWSPVVYEFPIRKTNFPLRTIYIRYLKLIKC